MLKLGILHELCATDGTEVNDVSDVSIETQSTQEVQETTEVQENVDTKPNYSEDEVSEWRKGYDSYNQQVQAYKELEARSKDALELYNYLYSNKDLAQKLYEFDKELQGGIQDKMPSKEKEEINSMRIEIEKMKIDKELASIKQKDPSVSELDLLQIANQNGVNLDLAYKIYCGSNYESRLKQELDKQSKNITSQIQNNNGVTKTLIQETDKANNDNASFGLSAMEVKYAEKLGMSSEEYAKWK